MSGLMYEYDDPLFSRLPPAKELVNINARMLADQQQFARGFGTSMEKLDRTLNEGFAGVNSHIDAMGNQISGQIEESTNYLADTVVNVGQNISNTTIEVGKALSSQVANSTAHLQGTMEHGFNYLGDTTVKVGQALGRQMADNTAFLGRQMFDNTQHLSAVFHDVGAQLGHTIFQSTAAITGSIFIASLNTNRVLSKAIRRQTQELKNELLEVRSEQMHTRRAITAAQLLTYNELAELKVQTLRNHTETIWMLMRQSSIMQDILETLKHPLRTKALELAETGTYLMSRGLFEQAREALTEAKNTIHDREPSIAVSLAFVYDNLRQGREVEERLQHAATLAEDRAFLAYVHGLLSDFYWQAGDKEKSLAASSRALSFDPFSPVVRVNHAAILAESGRISESSALLDGLLRDDTDHAKAILDRQTFYRHELVVDVLRFVQQHMDPAAEAVKNENAELQEQLRHIREHGYYRQFSGHKKRFDETLETLATLKARREHSPVSLLWHQEVNASYHRLTEIEADAAKAIAATQRYARLTAARDDVSQFLDAMLARSTSLVLDAARHPLLRMENEKIKASLAEINSPDTLHAACELIVNFLESSTRRAEADFATAAQSGFMSRGGRQKRVAETIASYFATLRDRVERLRVEKLTEPFQVCPGCFAYWPRSYRHCGQCGQGLAKPISVDDKLTTSAITPTKQNP